MIDQHEVFDAVRRGYTELETESNTAIIEYFSGINDTAVTGHLSHIKGILFEQEYVEFLASEGIDADIFGATNHPVTDISIIDDGILVNELQLKATDSVSYVNATIAENPNIDIVTTSEIAAAFESGMVTDSGIEDAILEQAVNDTLFDEVVNPVSPFSIIGWFFGLPF